MSLAELYRPGLGLVNDFYQLTMAYGYWKSGIAEREAVFHLTFRRCPFGGGYTVAAGLGVALELIEGFCFERQDLDYLGRLTGDSGELLFESGFLDYLAEMRMTCDVDAVPEGTVVFPQAPVLRVRGPLAQAQLLETPLLNVLSFQSLIATKAARVCQAAEGDSVLEFGLRRAQGIDGGLSASRAAYIGGCHATSNALAGRMLGLPVRGTHAHSWVLAFEEEQQAFDTYAEVMPDNVTLLVDTYDTEGGLRRAIEAGRRMRARGKELTAIRLDSGDLVALSRRARRELDKAGFPETSIVASGDLDELRIRDLKQKGASIDIWGVGTRLVTGHPDASLASAYKLGAIRAEGGEWQFRGKESDEIEKATLPGVLRVRRFVRENGQVFADGIVNELGAAGESLRDFEWPFADMTVYAEEALSSSWLSETVMKDGDRVGKQPGLSDIRERVRVQLDRLPPGLRDLEPSARFPVGIEHGLFRLQDSSRRGPPAKASS